MAGSRIINVAAALVFRDRRLLIAQRPHASHLGGLWEFPGGKLEPGETFQACLKRELKEELDLEIEVGHLLEALTHAYPEKTVHLRFFKCTASASEPRALGCAGFCWVTREELGSYAFPAADARLIERLVNSPDLWA